jgi:hypothetical protein
VLFTFVRLLSCLEILRQVCPDYFERAFAALDVLGEALSGASVEPTEGATQTPVVEQPDSDLTFHGILSCSFKAGGRRQEAGGNKREEEGGGVKMIE